MNLKRLKITILLLSIVQMGPIFMAPIMGDLIAAFPEYGASAVQMVMTFPNLVVVVISLFIGRLECCLSKKNLCITACIAILTGAIGMFLQHSNLLIMFIFSGCIGIGAGILLSITATMIAYYYEGDEKASLMGLQNSFNNIGGMALNIIGGLLAGIAWYFDFLAPMIIIPGLIMTVLYVPDEKGAKQEAVKVRVPALMFVYYAINLCFAILFNMLPTNIALLISAKGLGGSSFSGLVTAVFLSGGAVGGILYPKIKKKLEDRTIACAFLNVGLGFIVISIASNSVILLLGAFIGGCSITLVMSQMIFSISTKTKTFVTATAISYLMCFNNVGNFISPYIFSFVPGATLAAKFMFAGVIAIVFFAVLFILMNKLVQR